MFLLLSQRAISQISLRLRRHLEKMKTAHERPSPGLEPLLQSRLEALLAVVIACGDLFTAQTFDSPRLGGKIGGKTIPRITKMGTYNIRRV